jgi:hypothetical protein
MTKVETSLLDVKLIGDFASFANKEKETEKKILNRYFRTYFITCVVQIHIPPLKNKTPKKICFR